jgi:hypothetical protein
VITLPAPPAALPADTYTARHRVWWEQCDVLLRQEDQRQRDESEANRLLAIAASQAHGTAQQATADAMRASVLVQQSLAAAMNTLPPPRLPTRAELVFEMVKDQPQASVLTPGVIVKGAMDIVDAYVARYPGAVSG